MSNSESHSAKVKQFWEEQSFKQEQAGTKDLIGKQIEIRELDKFIHDGLRILDLGCGNGISALAFAEKYNIDLVGIDYAENMVKEAQKKSSNHKLKGSVTFQSANVLNLPNDLEPFDVIYTERCLINLENWELQSQAIQDICNLLKPSGIYVMMENSLNGLETINELRKLVGLTEIQPPWHNCYFQTELIESLKMDHAFLQQTIHYSSTYYLLSRVVNAWVSEKEGNEPSYDSPINEVALHLPSIGELGQGKIWVWERTQ